MTTAHLTRRISLAGLLTLFLVLVVNCGGETEPEDPKLTGEWTGQVSLGAIQAAIALALDEDDAGAVTGTMNWTVAGTTGTGPVTGTHNYPDVSLNLKIEVLGQELTGKYVAKLTTEDRMEGTFGPDDNSFPPQPANLERKSG